MSAQIDAAVPAVGASADVSPPARPVAAAVLPPASPPALAAIPKRSAVADLVESARDLWHARDLLQQLTLRDVRIRYKQAVMGFGWSIFMPMLVVLSGCVVRYAMARTAGGSVSLADIAGIGVKALPWSYFVGAIGFATASLVSNSALVSKVYFPREVLPLATTIAQGFDLVIGGVTLALILPFLGVSLNATLLWVPLLVLLLFVFTAASSLFLSCANLFFRDVKYIVQVLLTFGIFFTPVFFEPAMLGVRGAPLLMLNPMAPILEGFRLSVVEGHNLMAPLVTAAGVVAWSPWYLAYSAVWAFGGLLVAALIFHRSEFVFAEYV